MAANARQRRCLRKCYNCGLYHCSALRGLSRFKPALLPPATIPPTAPGRFQPAPSWLLPAPDLDLTVSASPCPCPCAAGELATTNGNGAAQVFESNGKQVSTHLASSIKR